MTEITYYLEELQTLLDSYGLDGTGSIQLAEIVTAALAVMAVAGLLLCFFGLKLVRVWGAILGFAIGFTGGFIAGIAFGQESEIVLIIAGVAGLIVAVLCAVFRRGSLFLVSLASGIGICVEILTPQELTPVLICAGVGVILAILAMKFKEPVIMVLTGIAGAFIAGQDIAALLGMTGRSLQIIITAALAVLGIVAQFLMESGRRKRRNLKKAAEIRKNNSTANEVERARAVMEDLDDQPESEEEEEIHQETDEESIDEEDWDEEDRDEEDPDDDIIFLDEEDKDE